MRTIIGRIIGGAIAALALGIAAGAAPVAAGAGLTVTITEPADGAIVSRGATPTLRVVGGAGFDTPAPAEPTSYVGRVGDPGRLSITPTGDEVGAQRVEKVTPLNEVSEDPVRDDDAGA